MDSKGLTIIHTGDGKGKTTAALGLAIRAWGDGLKVLILQFIKGGWQYGELRALEKLGEGIVIRQCGNGFTQQADSDAKKDKEAAAAALREAQEEMMSEKWDMLILDEVHYAIKFGLLDEQDVLKLIQAKPVNLHLVLTGRGARPALIDAADLVTEMKMIKHPFQKGIKAQKGIEF